MKFGFLTDNREFECSDFSIVTVDNFDKTLETFYDHFPVSDGWIYGPKTKLKKTTQEEKKFRQLAPIISSSFYLMPTTHEIKSSITDEAHLKFLILGYSFLQGLYLNPQGHSFLNRIPYEPGRLNGLILIRDDYVNGMEIINHFYKSFSVESRNQMFACMHWFLIGQTFNFEWDRFEAQYKVLDGIFRLSNIRKTPHASRPVELAKKFGLKIPHWAKPNAMGQSQLSKDRNELIHEAKYGGHPIGYSYPSTNYSLEFTSFNTKLIAATLGIEMPYLYADPKNSCQWAWDIKAKVLD